jgi:hypothetical protein
VQLCSKCGIFHLALSIGSGDLSQGKREGLAQTVDTAVMEVGRFSLTTATLILRMARPEIDRAEPDEVESMPRNNSAGKPNYSSETALSAEVAASCCFGVGNDTVRGERLAATPQGLSARRGLPAAYCRPALGERKLRQSSLLLSIRIASRRTSRTTMRAFARLIAGSDPFG